MKNATKTLISALILVTGLGQAVSAHADQLKNKEMIIVWSHAQASQGQQPGGCEQHRKGENDPFLSLRATAKKPNCKRPRKGENDPFLSLRSRY